MNQSTITELGYQSTSTFLSLLGGVVITTHKKMAIIIKNINSFINKLYHITNKIAIWKTS